MKTTVNTFIALCLVLIISSSTSRDNRLSAGSHGITRQVKPTDVTGNQIFSGNGAPGVNTGANGDFYIDLSTGDIYGPKLSTGWGTRLLPPDPVGGAGGTVAAAAIIPA